MSTSSRRNSPAPLPRRVILASASPRRRELLLQIGIEADVMPADVDEESIRHADPVTLATELARAKARAVLDRLAALPGNTDARAAGFARRHSGAGVAGDLSVPLLAADTVVAVDDEILEKPSDAADAMRMLELLSGRTHEVVTGVAVALVRRAVVPGGEASVFSPILTRSCVTHVTFAPLSGASIDDYLASGEWHGVAGAYRIQGLAARYVTHISGSYSNVVGLPLHLVFSILTGPRDNLTGINP